MKKSRLLIVFILTVISLCGLVLSPQNIYAAQKFGNTLNVVILGDSIAAGYAPQDGDLYSEFIKYNDDKGTAEYTVGCYGELFTQRYQDDFTNINIISHAVSGHKSQDLLTLLQNNTVRQSVQNADVIVLCIGANNVLGPALENIGAFLGGSITIEQCESQFQSGLNQFKNDYPTILERLTQNGKARVYPMTIYDPDKYASLNDITIVPDMVSMFISAFESKFQQLKTTAIDYLKQINNYIKLGYAQDVAEDILSLISPVDVFAEFEKITKSDYGKYVNVDTTKMTLDLNGIFIGDPQLTQKLMNSIQTQCMNSIYFDPHPTKLGHQKIAEIYTNSLNDVYIKADKTLSGQVDDFNLTYTLIGEIEDYTLNLYKFDTQLTKLRTITSTTTQIDVSDISGHGYIYLALEKSNTIVSRSNPIEFDLENIDPITAQVSISCSQNINGNQFVESLSSIAVSYTLNTNSTNQLTLKLSKIINGHKQLIAQFNTLTSGTKSISTTNLLGSGTLILDCYDNEGTLLATSNTLAFSFQQYQANILCSTLAGDVNSISQITLNLNTNIPQSYVVNVYKIVAGIKTHITNIQSTMSTVIINTSDLIGSGTIFVECWVNGLTVTSNSLNFNFTNEKFVEISTDSQMVGASDSLSNILIEVNYNINGQFTVKLIKEVDGQTTQLTNYNIQDNIITINPNNLIGEGILYVIIQTQDAEVISNRLHFNITQTQNPVDPQDPIVPPTQDTENAEIKTLNDLLPSELIANALLITSGLLILCFAGYIIIKAIKRN